MFHSTCPLALLTLLLLANRFSAAPAPHSNIPISWGGCDRFGVSDTDPNLGCGYLEVPMDYHDSSAGYARLAAARYSATASEKLGTIFFNPGGPGSSGVDAVAELGQWFSQSFQGLYDFISWDPRGVGRTTPGAVYCFNTTEEDAEFWKNTVVSNINETISGKFDQQDYGELYSQAELTERKFKAFTAGCQSGSSGPYLKYLGTSSTIRDLISLGDAIVGQGQLINYWGVSYGTVIGFNFINMFPERSGHVILDGVVDPNIWGSYKILQSSLADTEKTFSGLTDGCAIAGRPICKLAEITGDNATGDDVKALVNNALDATLELYRQGYDVPIAPGLAKALLFNLLSTPTTWSQSVNTDLYEFVALVLQASQVHNITIPGGQKYNIPAGGNITTPETRRASTSTLTSYTRIAVAGADDFNDNGVTIKDVFDIIVNNTREITPTFGAVWSPGYYSYGWPVRSVERLPINSPAKLKTPVLIIGNTADPITPLSSVQKVANSLGDNAFLVEQLGFGHTSFAQTSSCTLSVIVNYFTNSTLPQGRIIRCPVDDPNLFTALEGITPLRYSMASRAQGMAWPGMQECYC